MRRFTSVTILLIIMIVIFIPRSSFAEIIQRASETLYSKTCKEIGMIPNDPSKANNNYVLLSKELNYGTKILVDNKYYLNGANGPISATAITKNLYIEGVTENAGFSFTNTTGSQFLFNIQTKNVSIQKVKFTQLNAGYMFVFNMNNGQKLDNFVIEHCYFEGNIRLVTWSLQVNSIKKYIDPTLTDYGITNFAFNYNTCRNLKQIYYGFIYLDDVPISHAQVIGNDIKNFVYVFYNQGITNDNPFANKVAERMSYLEVRDNIVIGENSWNGAPQNQTYHCFVLFEGNKCSFINNHIEGLHVIDRNTVVYDSYLSCWDLDYEQNYWKNNICFSPTKTYGDLMKSKKANKSDYHGLNRTYRNNTYIVEKSYADVFKRPYNELWVSLNYYQDDMDTVIVENNNINVYRLKMHYGQPIHNYTFSNNKIHAYKTMETFNNCILPAYSLANPSPSDTYIARNNEIIIDTPTPYTDKQNSLIIAVAKQHEVKQVKIIFEDNYIKWPNLDSIISSPLGDIPIIEDISVVGNTIITTRPGTQTGKTLYSGIRGIYRNYVLDNIIEIPSKGFNFWVTPRGGIEQISSHTLLKAYPSNEIPIVGLNIDNNNELISTSYNNQVNLKCKHSSGIEDFSFDFSHFNKGNSSANTVQFMSIDGKQITQALDGSGKNNGTIVQLNGVSSKILIKFKNAGVQRGFYLYNSIPLNEYCTYDITVK